MPDASTLRLVRIRNTLHLGDLLVTEPLLEEARKAYDDTGETTTLFALDGQLESW